MNVMDFLAANVKPATGCTEPIAVAYATSVAYHALGGLIGSGNAPVFRGRAVPPEIHRVEGISIKTDRDVYKNSLAISIPGTGGQRGMAIASGMGLYCDPRDGLNLFAGLRGHEAANAHQLISAGKIRIEDVTDEGAVADLDISVRLSYRYDSATRQAVVRLQHYHDNITSIELDGHTAYEGDASLRDGEKSDFPGTLAELIDIAKNMSCQERQEVYKGIEMNLRIAEEGLRGEYGIGHAKNLQQMMDEGILGDGIVSEIRIMAAAAGDARMGGANMPVMSTAGSGNQGITALIPIAIVGRRYGIDREKTAEAALLSHLVTKYIKDYSGHLSAICGCAIKAGMGASAGVAYLMGGGLEEINNAINIMASNLTGMICDGAKESCSLKLSTAAGTAAESAFMALAGITVPEDNGIVYADAEETIRGVGRISHAMVATDQTIVQIMQEK